MILITHNILWSKYKGAVFSALNELTRNSDLTIEFLQIAETEGSRVGLTGVDLSYHRYPYTLMFSGAYDTIPKLRLILRLFGAVWSSKANVVIIAGYHTVEYWAMLIAARLQGKLVGVFCDSTGFDKPPSSFKSIFKRIFFSQCDAYFCYGVRSKEYLISHGATEKNIYFRCQAAALPHDYCVDSVVERRTSMRSSLDIRFLYVGRLSVEKNIADLLNAFKVVLPVHPGAKLIVVGDGPLRKELNALARDLSIHERVVFTGAKDVIALSEEYLAASCLILPSSSEPWGLVANEALSYGCPIIVSNRCGCVPELVVDGVTGYSFECGDITALAKILQSVPFIFDDVLRTAHTCINHISYYSPEAAASQILNGCAQLLTQKLSDSSRFRSL